MIGGSSKISAMILRKIHCPEPNASGPIRPIILLGSPLQRCEQW
jgi:hypothetical protein